jgi:hypothetical protein
MTCRRRPIHRGLLTVIRARAASQDLIAILKLEREVGVHVVIDEEGAKRVINLEFLKDLTLTRKTRYSRPPLSS